MKTLLILSMIVIGPQGETQAIIDTPAAKFETQLDCYAQMNQVNTDSNGIVTAYCTRPGKDD